MQRSNRTHLEAVKRSAEVRLESLQHALSEVSSELVAAQQDAGLVTAGAVVAEQALTRAQALLRMARKRWRFLEILPVTLLKWKVHAREAHRVRRSRAKIVRASQKKEARAALRKWSEIANFRQRIRRTQRHIKGHADRSKVACVVHLWRRHLSRRRATTEITARLRRHVRFCAWARWQEHHSILRRLRRAAVKVKCMQSRRCLASALRTWRCDFCWRDLAARDIQAAAKRRQSKGTVPTQTTP